MARNGTSAISTSIGIALDGAVDAGMLAADDVVPTLSTALVEALAKLPEPKRNEEIDKIRGGIVDAVRLHLDDRDAVNGRRLN